MSGTECNVEIQGWTVLGIVDANPGLEPMVTLDDEERSEARRHHDPPAGRDDP